MGTTTLTSMDDSTLVREEGVLVQRCRQAKRGAMHKYRIPSLLLAVLVCIAYLALAMQGVAEKSGTADEFAHVTGGYAYWAFNDYRLQPENGNWAQRIVSLPSVLARAPFPSLDQQAWRTSNVWVMSDQFFFAGANDADALLRRARWMVAIVGASLGLIVFLWSRSLFGGTGAWISLIIFAFSPETLANGALATSDIIATTSFILLTWALWTVLHRVTPWTVLQSIVATGAAFLSKFSAPIFIPIAVCMVIIRLASRSPLRVRFGSMVAELTGRRRLAVVGGVTFAHVIGVLLIIWASYGFRYSTFNAAITGQERLSDPWVEVVDSSFTSRAVQWARDHELLPEAYLFGQSHVLAYARHRSAFLNGNVQQGGWRWFFPYATLVKTTIPQLLLFGAAFVVIGFRLIRRRTSSPDDFRLYDLIPLALLAGWYWLFAISSHLNIGYRHMLPAIVAEMILAGALGPVLVRAWRPNPRPAT
jgi:hypothetical protein